MRRKWARFLLPLLLVAGAMWLYQIRFTPVSAVRTISWVRGEHLETREFAGGAGVLLKNADTFHAYTAYRWGWLFWRPRGGTSLHLSKEKKEPLSESASWTALDREGRGVSVIVGRAWDQRVERVRWLDEEQVLSADRHFFFVRRRDTEDMFPRAVALSKTGQELYEWSGATFYNWQPVILDSVAFAERPGPAAWYVPVPSDQGNWAVTGADPLDVARRFALPANGTCDCNNVSVQVLKTEPEPLTYLVRLEELKDDSIRTVAYLVELARTGATWKVAGASYTTECRRGVTADGYCQ